MGELMTAYEATRYLRFNHITLCRLTRQGKVPAVKIGGEWRGEVYGAGYGKCTITPK